MKNVFRVKQRSGSMSFVVIQIISEYEENEVFEGNLCDCYYFIKLKTENYM